MNRNAIIDARTNDRIPGEPSRKLVEASRAEQSGTGIVPAIRSKDGTWDLTDASDPCGRPVYID